MKTKRILPSTLGLIAGIASLLPVPAAAAGGPLLSGYGGPGAGDQAIIGAALIGGPSGGGSAGGGSGGSGSGGRSVAASGEASGSGGAVATGGSTVGGSPEGGGAGSHSSSKARSHIGSATHHRAAGANPQNSAHRGDLGAVTAEEAAESWFSGGDWLALVLVAGVLALLALTTVRLARTRHE